MNGQILRNGQITIGFIKRIVFVVIIYHPRYDIGGLNIEDKSSKKG